MRLRHIFDRASRFTPARHPVDVRIAYMSVVDPIRATIRAVSRSARSALMLSAIALASAGAQTSTCRAATDSSAVLRGFLSTMVSTTDPDLVALRSSVGIPAMDSTQIAIVTDTRICNNLVDAMNTAYHTAGMARHLYVFKMGKTYAVQDPEHMIGEYFPTVVFDSRYTLTGTVLAP